MRRHPWAACLAAFFIVVAARAGEGPADDEAKARTQTFTAEITGLVKIEAEAGKPATVWLHPREGAPLRVDKAGAEEWKIREGRWVEAKGLVRREDGVLFVRAWDISVKKREPRARDLPVEAEGRVAVDEAGVARVHTGEGAWLRIADDESGRRFRDRANGAWAEVKGGLVDEAGEIALRLAAWDLDDDHDDDDD